MKKTDVKIGGTYMVKVASNLVPVKITREHDKGGWEGTSVKTGKAIRIKTAQRLRDEAGSKSGSDAPKPAKPKARATDDKPKKLGLLDAAAQVLARSDEPLNTKQMVEQVTEQGLWTPGAGKTPAATLYSAILREMQNKGDQARFTKVERGKFTIRKGA